MQQKKGRRHTSGKYHPTELAIPIIVAHHRKESKRAIHSPKARDADVIRQCPLPVAHPQQGIEGGKSQQRRGHQSMKEKVVVGPKSSTSCATIAGMQNVARKRSM